MRPPNRLWRWTPRPGVRAARGPALPAGAAVAAAVLAILTPAPHPLEAQATHLLQVVGLGGDPAYRETFLGWALEIHEAALDRFGFPSDQVQLLAEDPTVDDRITGRSDREGVEAALERIRARAGGGDRVLVILIGHGSFRGDEARFNLPGRDLNAREWDVLLDALGERPVAVVNAASASGPFAEALAGPGRTVITATKTGGERNETRFGRYLAEAFGEEGADLDKDGALSLLELFEYARAEVARSYEEANLLLTEHALLEDDGDGEGSESPSAAGPDGQVAANFRLAAPVQLDLPAEIMGDSVLVRLMNEKASLEARVAALRARRGEMDPAAYDAQLEEILLELALKNREITRRGGGG